MLQSRCSMFCSFGWFGLIQRLTIKTKHFDGSAAGGAAMPIAAVAFSGFHRVPHSGWQLFVTGALAIVSTGMAWLPILHTCRGQIRSFSPATSESEGHDTSSALDSLSGRLFQVTDAS